MKRLSEQLQAENRFLQEEINDWSGDDEIVGESLSLSQVRQQIEHVAATDASVLLLGETGTGKELFARAIHQHSRRKAGRMVKVNLAALPATLIESELFGHVKGAFTGATENKIGRFQLADGGTLFLDEIGELDPSLETKLLRVLQEGEFERLGSGESRRVDVRIVAATNRDLSRAMAEEKFRPDLYYRLAVFPIEIPPLRRRREDIPLLVWRIVSSRQTRLGRDIRRIPDEAMRALIQYEWPGNVRELENVIERAMILSQGHELVLDDSFRLSRSRRDSPVLSENRSADRTAILLALQRSCWKIKGRGNAAETLGLKPSTLRYRMKTLGIERPPRLDK